MRLTPETIRGCVAMMRYLNEIDYARPFRQTSLDDVTDDLLLRLATRIEAVQS